MNLRPPQQLDVPTAGLSGASAPPTGCRPNARTDRRAGLCEEPAHPGRPHTSPGHFCFICFVLFCFILMATECVCLFGMSESEAAATESGPARENRCNYPGCTRPRRPDPATGRPSRYCEETDAGGGPLHNRASAFKARRANQLSGVTVQEDLGTAAPVSMARATLDQRLDELPGRLEDLRSFLGDMAATVRAASDLEAAGAEVEDAHRDALSKITDAERRAVAAERAARVAEARAEQAERDREEADALAEESAAELAQVREEAQAEVVAVRSDADARVAHAEQQVVDAAVENASQLAQRDAAVERAQQEAAAARMEAAAAAAVQRGSEADATRERGRIKLSPPP